jgi:hypothetical protein
MQEMAEMMRSDEGRKRFLPKSYLIAIVAVR